MKRIIIFVFLVCFVSACNEDLLPPEIWIDVSPVYIGVHSISEDADPYHFDLQITNRGEETLVIDSMVIRGDENCAFAFDGPDVEALGENGSAFVRGWYDPVTAADDNIAIEIYYNSADSPLIVPVCGKAVHGDTGDQTLPPSCDPPPADQPDC